MATKTTAFTTATATGDKDNSVHNSNATMTTKTTAFTTATTMENTTTQRQQRS